MLVVVHPGALGDVGADALAPLEVGGERENYLLFLINFPVRTSHFKFRKNYSSVMFTRRTHRDSAVAALGWAEEVHGSEDPLLYRVLEGRPRFLAKVRQLAVGSAVDERRPPVVLAVEGWGRVAHLRKPGGKGRRIMFVKRCWLQLTNDTNVVAYSCHHKLSG